MLDGEIVAARRRRPSRASSCCSRACTCATRRRSRSIAQRGAGRVHDLRPPLARRQARRPSSPYRERRRAARGARARAATRGRRRRRADDGEDAFATSRELGFEGVVAKRVDSKYEPGRRSPAWRKVKHELRQEFVVGGWSPGQGGATGEIGALLVGYYDADGALRYAGKVGTGFTEAELDRLDALLAPLETTANPFAGGGVPRDAQFVEARATSPRCGSRSGPTAAAIRHPAYLGLRDDKRRRTSFASKRVSHR